MNRHTCTIPAIIWCRQRTGSISLFAALCSASDHPAAEIEPFDFSPVGDRQFTHVGKRARPADRNRSLRQICDAGWMIKHCYENLSAEFNRALAEISTRAGYRHIHLVRRDELARLISKGVAEQHGTWGGHEWTRERYAQYVSRGQSLPPLDVPMLARYHRDCLSKWEGVRPLLRSLELRSEDLFTQPISVLSKVGRFLHIPESRVEVMARELGHDHRTRDIWRLLPNIPQLREAIAA